MRFAWYAWGVLVCNELVILLGAFVRATGSGAGCGSHWPLCNGEVVPQAPSMAMLIEYSHRLTSGLALVATTVLLVWAWRAYPAHHRVRMGALFSFIFLIIEALIGAGLVLLEYVAANVSLARAGWMAGHLLNTFCCWFTYPDCLWLGGQPMRCGTGRPGVDDGAGAGGPALAPIGITALGDTPMLNAD
jgi:heme A synthase